MKKINIINADIDGLGHGSRDTWSQYEILPGVSRTFALTIPQLPETLRCVVTNAYLLCRITDTIEDDPTLSTDQKESLHEEFTRVVRGDASPARFASRVGRLLSDTTPTAEQELIHCTPRVIEVTDSLNPRQKKAVASCIEVMSSGMPKYERRASLSGLRDLGQLDEYCYYVAGVVGEMLTELFSDYSDAVARHYEEMMHVAPSFGQGLQMTNILKDVWEDRARGVCWLPQDVFDNGPGGYADLAGELPVKEFARGMARLIAVAHGHLQNALRYTLLIPSSERGIRLFCLWALGLAVLTLRKIHNNPGFRSGAEVKVKRSTVKMVIAATNISAQSDSLLRWQFDLASAGLPRLEAEPAYVCRALQAGLGVGEGLGRESGES